MLLSPDSSKFYSFYTYGATTYLYYTGFSASTGSVIGTRYKSSSSINSVFGLAQSGDYLLACTLSRQFVSVIQNFDFGVHNQKLYTRLFRMSSRAVFWKVSESA